LAPRRRVLTPIQETQAYQQATEWLAKDITEIIPTPPVCNNLVLVAKKDGRIRVCIDCTPANDCTKEFDWPLPRLQDLRHFVKGAQWFSRLDLQDAFFRIWIPIKHRHLTAFTVKGTTYQFKRMPFGLKTAPATFQRFMDWGLSQFQAWAFWYIDDILITADTASQLRSREQQLRQKLKDMGCVVNEQKSVSGKTSLLFAGLWVMSKGLGPNLDKVKQLLAIQPPTNKTEAQSALGLVSYLRDFIPLVGHFTAMLYPDKQGLKLDLEVYQEQWRLLISHLIKACSINHHFNDQRPGDLYTDASQHALGVILIQDQRIISVASRKLSPAETRYSATDREHLGLVYAAERFKLITHQSSTQVRVSTDHQALVTRKQERLTPRQARWQQVITSWMPNVTHVKGKVNPADFISRWRVDGVGAVLKA
jgi:hypothetical protein